MATFVGADTGSGCKNGSNTFQNGGFSGLLGLGWPALASEGKPIVQNLLSQLSQQLFTVWLNRFV